MHALMHAEHLELGLAHVAFLACLAISVWRVETYAYFDKF